MWPGRRRRPRRPRAKLPGPVYVVKSQIHAGGRGAGRFTDDPNGKGGVRVVKSAAEVEGRRRGDDRPHAGHQADRPGRASVVSRVYVEDGCDIKRELYLGLLVDRDSSRVTIMASTEGGMEIEEVAEHHPEKILKVAVDPASGISGFHARKLAFGARPDRQAGRRLHQIRHRAVRCLHRTRLRHRRDQPAGRHRRGRASWRWMPRCPSTTTRCSATRTSKPCATIGDGPEGARGGQPRPELRGARRRDRLHGERRRPGDGHHGHHQAVRLVARPTSSMSAAPRMRRG